MKHPEDTTPARNIAISSTTYFKSPIETLKESLEDPAHSHISLHDIAEAYSTLCARILAVAVSISQNKPDMPALHIFKKEASYISRCLHRDIARALNDNIVLPSSGRDQIPDSMPSTLAIIEEDAYYARDAIMVCHRALQTLSDIFAFTALQSAFHSKDLEKLLTDILAIMQASFIPTASPQKTLTLAVWILSTQELPPEVLTACRKDLIAAVTSTIDDDDPGAMRGYMSDALKALGKVVQAHPSVFLEPFSPLLPRVLRYLTVSFPSCRVGAAHALCGFSSALLSQSPTVSWSLREKLTRHVREYVESQSQKKSKIWDTYPAILLKNLLADTLDVDKQSNVGQTPQWALTVLACLVIISGGSIFAHAPTLKLVVPLLAKSVIHTSSSVRCLQACIWKCLIWCYMRACVDDNDIHESAPSHALSSKVRERAFSFLKQELRWGIGEAFVSSILGPPITSHPLEPEHDNTHKAIDIITEMMKNKDLTLHSNGVSLLNRLMNGIGSSLPPLAPHDTPGHNWDIDRLLEKKIFDGTVISKNWGQPSTVLAVACPVSNARPFTEGEIVHYWEELCTTWSFGVLRALEKKEAEFTVPNELLHVWQALLLVQAQLTQGHGHLTAADDFGNRAVDIICNFFTWNPSQSSRLDRPRRLLTLVNQLWSVMKIVFATPALALVSGPLLTTVLKQNFDLSIEEIKTEWVKLCTTVVDTDSLESLLTNVIDNQTHITVKRLLWSVLANCWQATKSKPDWQTTVAFLDIPLHTWTMTDGEHDLWSSTLRAAVVHADSTSTTSLDVVEAICLRAIRHLSSHRPDLKAVSTLLSLSHPEDQYVPNKLFSYIAKLLCNLYPALPEILYPTLQVVNQLTNLIVSCHKSALVGVLSALSEGICVWIRDDSKSMLEAEYNRVMIPFYCNALEALKKSTLRSQDIHTLAPFLCSVFNRIVPPLHGPVAFKKFWDLVCPRLGHPDTYPNSIKKCLTAYYEAFGHDSTSAETQSERSVMFIPDSQPSASSQDDIQLPLQQQLYAGTTTAISPDAPLSAITIDDTAHNACKNDYMRSQSLQAVSSPSRSTVRKRETHNNELQPRKRRRLDIKAELGIENLGIPISTTEVLLDSPLTAQPTRLKFDGIELPTYREIQRRRYKPTTKQPETPRTTSPVQSWSPEIPLPKTGHAYRSHSSTPLQSSQDYASWETKVQISDLEWMTPASQSREDASYDEEVPDSQPSSSQQVEEDMIFTHTMQRHDVRRVSFSEEVSEASSLSRHTYPERENVRIHHERSQTVPVPSGSVQRTRATSARLEVLRNAYEAIRAEGSQMPTQEIESAAQLVREINGVLNAKLGARLGGNGTG